MALISLDFCLPAARMRAWFIAAQKPQAQRQASMWRGELKETTS